MLRIGALLIAVVLSLSGCSSNDEVVDADADVTSASPDNEASSATTEPPNEAVMTTSSPPPSPSASQSATTSSQPSAEEPPVETTPEVAPSPEPEPDPCSPEVLSLDLLGSESGVESFVCEQGWAYAYYVGETGDAEFIAERQGGTWVKIAVLGSPVCQEELMDQGAPRSVVTDFLPCDVMYPPEAPTQPAEDCILPTEQFGATYVTLYNVSCDEAADIFYSAADNYPPSFDQPIVLQNGWECWVYPHDPGYRVAGECHAQDGSADFILNVPSY